MEAKDTYGYWCSYYLGVWLVSLLDHRFLFFLHKPDFEIVAPSRDIPK